MSGSRGEAEPRRFLFDVHVHHGASLELRRRGIDVAHAGETRVADRDDVAVLLFAVEEGRILVTRNYRDFAPLVEAFAREGRSFPGVLFLSPAIPQSDAGAHLRALEAWIDSVPPGRNPIANGCGWLKAAE